MTGGKTKSESSPMKVLDLFSGILSGVSHLALKELDFRL